MIVHFCDRCHKEIGSLSPSIKRVGLIITYINKEQPLPTNDKRKGHRPELCNDCQEQLEKWWNYEKDG